MKLLFLLATTFLLSAFAYSQEEGATLDEMEKINNIYYIKGKSNPYSGVAYATYPKEKITGIKGNYVDGLRDGIWTWWYKSGDVMKTTTYVNGIKSGPCTYYHKNGEKKSEIIFSNNKNIKQESWDDSGKKTANPSFQKF